MTSNFNKRLELKLDDRDYDFLKYNIPVFGLYELLRDKNNEFLQKSIMMGGFGEIKRFDAMMISMVPLNIIYGIAGYKLIQTVAKNPVEFLRETWETIGLIGKYSFYT